MKLEKLLAKLDPAAGPETVADAATVTPRGFLAMIEMMREHHRYDFADDTLRGIYDSVEAKGYVTEGQLSAVRNIRHSVRNWEDCDVEDV
jgi:hypothetical protein